MGVKIEARHPWLVEYSGLILNRFEVGKDGRTAFERCKGKKAKTMGLEFGEAVLWKRRPGGGHLGKLMCLWSDGVYLGVKGSTGEIIVGNLYGVWKTRTAQRRPKEERWEKENVNLVTGVPWRTSEKDLEADGEALGGKMIDLREGQSMERKEEEDVREKMKLNLPRSFRTSEEDYQTHGYSRQCPGCKALLGNTTRQKHSDSCNRRMAEALAGQKRVEDAKERKRKFVEDALEEEEKCRERKEEAKKTKMHQIGEKKNIHEIAEKEKIHEIGDTKGDEMEGVKRGYSEEKGEEAGPKRTRAEAASAEAEAEIAVNQEEEFEASEWAIDDVHGVLLDPKAVHEAREEELEFMRRIGVFEDSSREECWRRIGKDPITTKWIDTDKGVDGEVLVRSRLVARDFKKKGESER